MLRIHMSKRADGGSVLRCERADGSVTWQRNEGRTAAFFPLHDLTHFAVESELRCRRAFYGLIAEGWDIADTTGKGRRGALSDEALEVEHLVGLLDGERASGVCLPADEINRHAATFADSGGREAPRTLREEDMERVRERLRDLLGAWTRLEAGATLVLTFDPQ